MTLACDLPYHLYGYVDRSFLSDKKVEGWEPAVLFGITLPVNRAIGLTVLLECGAQYRELPSHAWAFEPTNSHWDLVEAQAWDCFGGDAQVLEYSYLKDLPCLVKSLPGFYLFTLEYGNNGFSRYPAQSKSMHAIELTNHRLTWQPNDRVLWNESSFNKKDGDTSWLRRQTEVWGVEG